MIWCSNEHMSRVCNNKSTYRNKFQPYKKYNRDNKKK